VHRLDEHAEVFGFEHGGLTLEPSDYFRRQCFVAVEEVEPGLEVMLAEYPDSVVFASDYPHADGTFPGSTDGLLASTTLAKTEVERVLLDNSLRLYGLDQLP
jgi:predicted TIM-barrel fold metal-dependent hydrolase